MLGEFRCLTRPKYRRSPLERELGIVQGYAVNIFPFSDIWIFSFLVQKAMLSCEAQKRPKPAHKKCGVKWHRSIPSTGLSQPDGAVLEVETVLFASTTENLRKHWLSLSGFRRRLMSSHHNKRHSEVLAFVNGLCLPVCLRSESLVSPDKDLYYMEHVTSNPLCHMIAGTNHQRRLIFFNKEIVPYSTFENWWWNIKCWVTPFSNPPISRQADIHAASKTQAHWKNTWYARYDNLFETCHDISPKEEQRGSSNGFKTHKQVAYMQQRHWTSKKSSIHIYIIHINIHIYTHKV